MIRRCRQRERLAAAPESGCEYSGRGSGTQGQSGTLLSAVAMEQAIGWQKHQAGDMRSITYNIHHEYGFVKKTVEKPLRSTPVVRKKSILMPSRWLRISTGRQPTHLRQ